MAVGPAVVLAREELLAVVDAGTVGTGMVEEEDVGGAADELLLTEVVVNATTELDEELDESTDELETCEGLVTIGDEEEDEVIALELEESLAVWPVNAADDEENAELLDWTTEEELDGRSVDGDDTGEAEELELKIEEVV